MVWLALPSTSYRLPSFVKTAIRIGIKSYLHDSLRCSIHEQIRKTSCRICSLEIGVLIRQKFMCTNLTGLTDQHSLYQHVTLSICSPENSCQCQSLDLSQEQVKSLEYNSYKCHSTPLVTLSVFRHYLKSDLVQYTECPDNSCDWDSVKKIST